MVIYPSVLKVNRVVTPIVDVEVLEKVRVGSHLDVAESDEKNALDPETSIDYFELTTKRGNVGSEVDACISSIDSQKYAYPAECNELAKGGHFPEMAMFVIE